jgi:hypothetical protein
MNQLVCNDAPLRFLPYGDVCESVKVGVVVHCPQTDFFGCRLAPLERTARLTGFFPELDAKIFTAALCGIDRELARVQANHRSLPVEERVAPELAKEQMQRFCEVIRRREGLLHFGGGGTILADTPQAGLEALFGRLVERQFTRKHEYPEMDLVGASSIGQSTCGV